MNDFTKEELEVIRHSLRVDIARGVNYVGEKVEHKNAIRHDLALNKLQSMIDNYCEHKNTQMDCDGGISLVCSDCGITTVDVI